MYGNWIFSKKYIFIAGTLIFAIIIFPGTDGLTCNTCYPCDSNEAGVPTVCDMDGYPEGQGYVGCSFEIGAEGHRRKRCVWLRFDPDVQEPNDPTYRRPARCHLSPMDDINDDCYCFTDNCNKENLAPTVYPSVDQYIR